MHNRTGSEVGFIILGKRGSYALGGEIASQNSTKVAFCDSWYTSPLWLV